MTGAQALKRNDATYLDLLGLIARMGPRHRMATAALVEATAEFCEFNHPGRFADGALENYLLDLIDDSEPTVEVQATPMSAFSRRRVLHVATQVCGVGGHTRTIRHWIAADSESQHSLLLTSQGDAAIPNWLGDAVRMAGGTCHVLPYPASPLIRAKQARSIARRTADLVVLHHFGHDVVPIVAFAGPGPVVALVNHADHMFWMGGTVADVIVNQRDIGRELSECRRHTHRNVVLPVPLAESGSKLSKAGIRVQLGLPSDQVVLLSVGRACKYMPTPTHDFFRAARRILVAHSAAHLYLLGVAESDVGDAYLSHQHERFHFLGPRDSAADYQRAADVYLEGFPFGSQTALLEAALAGTPTVSAFTPPLRLLATNDEALTELVTTPADENAYVERVGELIGSESCRIELGRALSDSVRACHVGTGWQSRLNSVYALTDSLTHKPNFIPASRPQATADDWGLAEWQVGRSSGAGKLPAQAAAREVARHAAYALRQSKGYASAFVVLRRALRRWGPDRRVLADLAKLLPHRALTASNR